MIEGSVVFLVLVIWLLATWLRRLPIGIPATTRAVNEKLRRGRLDVQLEEIHRQLRYTFGDQDHYAANLVMWEATRVMGAADRNRIGIAISVFAVGRDQTDRLREIGLRQEDLWAHPLNSWHEIEQWCRSNVGREIWQPHTTKMASLRLVG